MKKYVILFCALFSLCLAAQPSVSSIREAYRTSVESKEKAQAFFDELKSVQKTNGTILMVYKGAAYMLQARYESIFKKKGDIKNGKDWIETYIGNHPNDVEARFVRLTIQENLPKIAGYNKNIAEDREFIKKKLPSVTDTQLKKMLQTIEK